MSFKDFKKNTELIRKQRMMIHINSCIYSYSDCSDMSYTKFVKDGNKTLNMPPV